MLSYAEPRGHVEEFPEFTGEQIYMLPFEDPSTLGRWSATVMIMLDGVKAPGVKYLMVDQAELGKGDFHRRPGRHIDGHWVADMQMHGNPTPGHSMPPPIRWRIPGHHVFTRAKEAIILASDIPACRGYLGAFLGPIGVGGDCDHLPIDHMWPIDLEPNTVYAGNVFFMHESLPVADDCQRTVVRINVPGWEP